MGGHSPGENKEIKKNDAIFLIFNSKVPDGLFNTS